MFGHAGVGPKSWTSLPTLLLPLLVAGFALNTSACRPSSSDEGDLIIDLSVSPTPPATGPARLTIRVTERTGAPVERALVQVQGTMSHPGMAVKTVSAKPEGDGRFVVEAFDFTMAGDWILTVSVGLPDRRSAQRDFPLRAIGVPAREDPGT